jgi:hypothetical protein
MLREYSLMIADISEWTALLFIDKASE